MHTHVPAHTRSRARMCACLCLTPNALPLPRIRDNPAALGCRGRRAPLRVNTQTRHKPQKVGSMLTAAEIENAKSVLMERIAQGDAFAASMLAAILKGRVTEPQAAAIRRIVERESDSADYSGVLATLRGSKEAFPRIEAVIGGTVITVRYTPKTSVKAKPENRDTAYVSSGVYKSESSKWYGRIRPDGRFVEGKDCTPEVRAWLDSLNLNAE